MADALLVTSSFLPGRGGIESYLDELCGTLAPRLAVLAAAERDGAPLPTTLPYATHPFPGRLLVPGKAAVEAILRAARREGTEKVLFGTPWPLVLAAPRLKKEGLGFAVIVHGAELTVPAALPGLGRRLAAALSSAELLLPVSGYTADRIRRLLTKHALPVPPIELLRARVDLRRFSPAARDSRTRQALGLESKDKVILCFGRLVPRKGVGRLVEAMDAIREQVPEAVLVVAGTGPEEKKLRRLAAREGARVVFAGRVPDDQAAAVYATADVFALPVADRWFGLEIEGLGVVLLEAAASEVPCVTGRSGGTSEAVVDNETGYVIDAKKRGELVGSITRLLTDPVRATRFGKAGRRHVEREFSSRSIPGALLRWLGP